MNTDPGHITEFWAGFTGTCGECALEVAIASAIDGHASEADMVAITHEMQQHGQAAANGASTLWALAREAERRGMKIALEWDYAEPFPHDWHSILLQNAGKKPVVIQLANGQALRDVETGAADEVGLRYHFIEIDRAQADGYVANDGDNPQVTQRYQVYSYGVLENAKPCGLLVLEPIEPQKEPIVGLPTGWKDDGAALHNPVNANVVVHGFRDFILHNPWDSWNVPLENEHDQNPVEYGNPTLGDGSIQTFRSGQLTWTKKDNKIFASWTGQELLAVKKKWQDAAANQQDMQQIAALKSQLTQLQQQLDVANQKAARFDTISTAIKTIEKQVS